MPWEVRFSNSKRLPYFYNSETAESRWEAPAGLSDAQIQALPGASQHLRGGNGPAPQVQANGDPQEKVQASHILAKHAQSRRPSSWKQAQVTRSIDEARTMIQGFIDDLSQLQGRELEERFHEIARTESDCSSARKGGDLGLFGRNTMQAAFEEASFKLQPGQLSGLVETDSGVHVILRTR